MTKLDLTSHKCPETYLFTKLALEKLAVGDKLQITFSCDNSATNVSKSVEQEHHAVISSTQLSEVLWELVVQKC